MQLPCPSCKQPIELYVNPTRGPDGAGNEGWVCLKCPAVICVNCYPQHTNKEHPEVYRADYFSKKSKK